MDNSNMCLRESRSMKCVHTTYTIQSSVDAFGDVLPSAKMENVRADTPNVHGFAAFGSAYIYLKP